MLPDMANIAPYQPSAVAASDKRKGLHSSYFATHYQQPQSRAFNPSFSSFGNPSSEQFSQSRSWKVDASTPIPQLFRTLDVASSGVH